MPKSQLTIELESWMYAAIGSKAKDLGCSESEVIQQSIKLMLGTDESSLSRILDRLLEDKLEAKIEEMLVKKLKDFDQKLEKKTGDRPKSKPESISIKPELSTTIRALQIGDRVQIRDQSSPHFLEKLTIVKVGMLMAVVQTTSGEQSFLKRDLRFIHSTLEDN